MSKVRLSPDRVFDPEPEVRRIARALYERTTTLPLICPHGHVDASLLAENAPFPEPTALLVTPDHYILRMLYSQGVPLEALGIVPRDGGRAETDPRAIWRVFASHVHLFLGTPTGIWLTHELHELFEIDEPLNGASADRVYDALSERLASPEFRPRALFDRFNIEVLATTDAATDPLSDHAAIRDSGWTGRVIPTFRPDAVVQIANPAWRDAFAALEQITGRSIDDIDAFVSALSARRDAFRASGATATDHGAGSPYTQRLAPEQATMLLQRAKRGEATADDAQAFEGHMLMEMAGLSVQDGMVMQLHPGVYRNHNASLAARFGPNIGGDIPVATEFTRNLAPLLNAYGNDARFRFVLFTLDESTYARELAPLAGHYPAVRLGPAWWFHDSIEGMTRFRQQTTETAGIWNTAGFNDDTRAFCSIAARHDLSRRVDANVLGRLVARHLVSLEEAHVMARALAYGLARETYRLDASASTGA